MAGCFGGVSQGPADDTPTAVEDVTLQFESSVTAPRAGMLTARMPSSGEDREIELVLKTESVLSASQTVDSTPYWLIVFWDVVGDPRETTFTYGSYEKFAPLSDLVGAFDWTSQMWSPGLNVSALIVTNAPLRVELGYFDDGRAIPSVMSHVAPAQFIEGSFQEDSSLDRRHHEFEHASSGPEILILLRKTSAGPTAWRYDATFSFSDGETRSEPVEGSAVGTTGPLAIPSLPVGSICQPAGRPAIELRNERNVGVELVPWFIEIEADPWESIGYACPKG